MTIESLVSRNDYVGNGSASIYAYGFKIIEDTDLLVTVQDGTTGVETTKTLNLNYTVSGEGEEAGGNVTLSANLTSGDLLTIRRVRPLLQETDIETQGVSDPSVLEDTFDHILMICQQQQDEINRSLRLPETEADLYELPTAAQRASKFLAFDADGDPIASDGGIDDALPVSSYIETLLDDANAAAARATLGITDAFPSGTKLVFFQATVPTGWTLDPSAVNDKALRVMSGSETTPGHADAGGGSGGTIAVSTGLAHTHTVAAHAHIVPYTAVEHKHETTSLHRSSDSLHLNARGSQFGLGSEDASSTAQYGTYAAAQSGRYRQLTNTIQAASYPSGTTRNTETAAPATDSKLGVLAYANVIVGVKD